MYPDFPSKFIKASVLIAFWAGINMGTHVAFSIGFGFDLGPGYRAYIQTHGSLQLIGWVGLFIMGVSIHFLSRLAHFKFVDENKITLIYRLMVSGLIFRFFFHSILPYFHDSIWYGILSLGVVISATLIAMGIYDYIIFLISIVGSMQPSLFKTNRDIRVFLIMNIIGWVVYAVGSLILTIYMMASHEVSLIHNWHIFLVDFFILFSVFPICFGVGLRALPLFLRLPPIKWNVKKFSLIYFIVIFSLINFKLINHYIYIDWLQELIYSLSILKDMIIIWFIFKLDILNNFTHPRTFENKKERVPYRKELRKGFPDYGEFGRFEWLIRPAFFWLLIGLILDILSQIGLMFKIQMGIGIDGIRHLWLAGFVSLLIMGMALRMIPGMTGAMKLEKPNRVAILSIIMNLSVIFRTMSIVLPESILYSVPNGGLIATRMFGLSGFLFLFGLGIFYYLMKPVLKINQGA
jgi:hypothetical protein